MVHDDLIIRPKGEDGYKTFSIRIKEELVAKIDAIAAETGRSRNELIGIFLTYAADRCRVEQTASEADTQK